MRIVAPSSGLGGTAGGESAGGVTGGADGAVEESAQDAVIQAPATAEMIMVTADDLIPLTNRGNIYRHRNLVETPRG
jgi:hypothetical protein